MHRKSSVSMLIVAFLTVLGCGTTPEEILKSPPKLGGTFPDVTLRMPAKTAIASYLGLPKATNTFDLSEVNADLLIIELSDLYCLYCHDAPPQARQMQKLIARHGLSARVPLIGISLGDSEYEASVFEEKFDVPFPVFPDPDKAVHRSLGRVGRPSFYAVMPKKNLNIVGVQSGLFENDAAIDTFIERSLRKSGLLD
mgnify:CR=1 FL=1